MNLPRNPASEPLVWLVWGIPAATVVAGVATFWIATHGADPTVSDPIDKRGLAISQRAGRDERARALEISGSLASERSADAIRFTVALTGATGAFSSPPMLRLSHPARPDADRVLRLVAAGEGRWSASTTAGDATTTRWMLSVETPDWRVDVPGLHRFGTTERVRFGMAAK